MGYNTQYELKYEVQGKPHHVPTGADIEDIAEFRENCDGMRYAIDINGETEESCNWYEHDADMKKMSLQFPHSLFTLPGDGEEAGDMWNKYYLNGKMQIAKAIITYPPFDEKLLE